MADQTVAEVSVKLTAKVDELSSAMQTALQQFTGALQKMSASMSQVSTDINAGMNRLASGVGVAAGTMGNNVANGMRSAGTAANKATADIKHSVDSMVAGMSAAGREAASGGAKISEGMLRAGRSATQAEHELGAATRKMAADTADAAAKTRGSLHGMESAFRSFRAQLLAVFSVAAIADFGKSIFQVGAQMQGFSRALTVVEKDQKTAAKDMEYVRAESERLGISLPIAAEAFTKIAAAANGTALAGNDVKRLFSALSEAGGVLGLSNERMRDSFLALSQMMSKPRLSMEELRQQLAEHIPGAEQIAQRALQRFGGSWQEAVKKGLDNVAFLRLFTAQLEKDFGSGGGAVHTATAELNRLGNAWYELKVQVAESGFLTAVTDGLMQMAAIMKDPAFIAFGKSIGEMLVGAFNALKDVIMVVIPIYETLLQTVNENGAALKLFAEIIGGVVITGLRALVGGIDVVMTSFNALGKVIGGVAAGAGAAFTGVASAVSKALSGDFSGAVASLSSARGQVVGVMSGMKEDLSKQFDGLASRTDALWKKMAEPPKKIDAPSIVPAANQAQLDEARKNPFIAGGDADKKKAASEAAKSARESAKLARDEASALLAILRERLEEEKAEIRRALDENEISYKEYYDKLIAMQQKEIDAEIAAKREQMASTKDTGQIARITSEITVLEMKRSEVAKAGRAEQIKAEQALQSELQNVKDEIGDILNTNSFDDNIAILERHYAGLLQRLERNSDEAGVKVVKKLINLKATEAELDKIEESIGETFEKFGRDTRKIERGKGSSGIFGDIFSAGDTYKAQQQAMQKLQLDMAKLEDLNASGRGGKKGASALARTRDEIDELQSSMKRLPPSIEGIRVHFANMATGLLNGTLTWKDVWQQTLASMVAGMVDMVTQIVAQWIWGETMRSAATESGWITRNAIELAGWAKGKALAVANAISSIGRNAYAAAAGAYQSASQIPYVGFILGPIAGAAAFAAVMAFGGGVSSAEGGWDIPSGIQPSFAVLHPREMVLPAEYADPLRRTLKEKGKRKGGAGIGGGSTHINIKAMDGASVKRVFANHSGDMAKFVQKGVKNGAIRR